MRQRVIGRERTPHDLLPHSARDSRTLRGGQGPHQSQPPCRRNRERIKSPHSDAVSGAPRRLNEQKQQDTRCQIRPPSTMRGLVRCTNLQSAAFRAHNLIASSRNSAKAVLTQLADRGKGHHTLTAKCLKQQSDRAACESACQNLMRRGHHRLMRKPHPGSVDSARFCFPQDSAARHRVLTTSCSSVSDRALTALSCSSFSSCASLVRYSSTTITYVA